MSELTLSTFTCPCKDPKKHRLILDGGSTGQYHLELCSSCYSKEDKEQVIKEEPIP